ncbi:hypothetical protein ABK905_04955 [Acerihabitans sp. KWT182]|uniref:DUF1795 domain-containing protein n=1 Tax=Acerihabitans sp. KWT182 TaxID=3157919 RepID=A0AAU7QCB0_9GAMM
MATAHRWRNPITGEQADLGSLWVIKQLEYNHNTVASSFISDNIVVNVRVVKDPNQKLAQVVDYLKTNEPSLRFLNAGTYGSSGELSNWTGIAASASNRDRHYVVHVTHAKGGYGIFIAAVDRQTAPSFSRLEAFIAQLDKTFGSR